MITASSLNCSLTRLLPRSKGRAKVQNEETVIAALPVFLHPLLCSHVSRGAAHPCTSPICSAQRKHTETTKKRKLPLFKQHNRPLQQRQVGTAPAQHTRAGRSGAGTQTWAGDRQGAPARHCLRVRNAGGEASRAGGLVKKV